MTDAHAQAKTEAAAKALQKKAIEEDYLTSDFAKAQDRLDKAITLCGTAKCSTGLRARLRRDLGVVLIGGQIDSEKGIGSFVDALKLEPSITLDPDLRTKDLDAAFAEAKKRAGLAAPTPPAPPPPAPLPTVPSGDFAHTPAPGHQTRTPVPIYAEYTGTQGLARVIVRYRGFGMTDWKSADLKRFGEKGWGGSLPCAEVQQGTMAYYLQGFNAANDPIATSGDRNTPYRTQVIRDRPSDPPHLPGQAPPAQCAESAASEVAIAPESKKEVGAFCEENSDCESKRCTESKCVAEVKETPKAPRFWVGAAGVLDFSFIPSTDDACKLGSDGRPTNSSNYYCMGADGTDFPVRAQPRTENDALVPSSNGGSDRVTGGGSPGNVRLLLSFDYALTHHLLLGARLGLVLRRYPGNAASDDGHRSGIPIHLEARATYLFGTDPLVNTGWAPYVSGAFGIGQFETSVPVQVIERQGTGAPVRQFVDAWLIGGPIFVSVGAGGRWAITHRFALLAGLRANLAFGNAFVPSVGPEIGGQFGF